MVSLLADKELAFRSRSASSTSSDVGESPPNVWQDPWDEDAPRAAPGILHSRPTLRSAQDAMRQAQAQAEKILPVRGDGAFVEDDDWGEFQQSDDRAPAKHPPAHQAHEDHDTSLHPSGFQGLSGEQRYAIGTLVCTLLQLVARRPSHGDFADVYARRILERLGLPEGTREGLLSLDVDERRLSVVVDECVSMIGDDASRFCAVQEMMSLSLVDGVYDARARTFLMAIAFYFQIRWENLAAVELAVAMHLVDMAKEAAAGENQPQTPQAVSSDATQNEIERERTKTDKKKKKKHLIVRVAKVSGIAVAGGVLFGVTGGLIAPALLGSLAGIGVAGAAALSATGAVASGAVVGSLFGVGGMAVAGNKARRRTRTSNTEFDFERPDDPRVLNNQNASSAKTEKKAKLFSKKGLASLITTESEADKLPESPSLHICLCVPAWLSSKSFGSSIDQFRDALELAVPCSEHIALRWDPRRLCDMGKAFASFWASKATVTTVQQVYPTVLASTSAVAGAVAAAIALPLTCLSAMDYIDNPWSVLISRANGAGQELADILSERAYGQRPVTLVGYSHGARVIFKCLRVLAQRGLYGIVDNAFLIGAPVSADTEQWGQAKLAVSGRLVNAYSGTDWALAVFHRATSHGLFIAGLTHVSNENVENVNMAFLGVRGHGDLREALSRCLVGLGVGTNRLCLPPAPFAVRKDKSTVPEPPVSSTTPRQTSTIIRAVENDSDNEGDTAELFRGKAAQTIGDAGRPLKDDRWSSEGDYVVARLDDALFLDEGEIEQGKHIELNQYFVTLANTSLPEDAMEAPQGQEMEGSSEIAGDSESPKHKSWFNRSKMPKSPKRPAPENDAPLSWAEIIEEQEKIDGMAPEPSEEEDEAQEATGIMLLEGPVDVNEGRTLPVSIGIEVTGRRVRPFFERGTIFPAAKTELFTNGADAQRSTVVRVVEGERGYTPLKLLGKGQAKSVRNTRLLAEMELIWQQSGERGRLRSSVCMKLDEGGNLTVTASERRRGGTIGAEESVCIAREKLTSIDEWRELTRRERERKRNVKPSSPQGSTEEQVSSPEDGSTDVVTPNGSD